MRSEILRTCSFCGERYQLGTGCCAELLAHESPYKHNMNIENMRNMYSVKEYTVQIKMHDSHWCRHCHFTLAGLEALFLLVGQDWSSAWPSEPT